MSLGLKASADGNSIDIMLGATVLATFSLTGVEAGGTILADAGIAQALTNTKKLITPAMLAAAFQGANHGLSANGYQRLPGGLIIQWGTTGSIASNASSGTITYPIAFPTSSLYVNYIGTIPVTAGSNTNLTLATKTTSNFSFINSYLSAATFNWFAIGY